MPGQVFYDASRKLILKGADGVAFVCDSQEARRDANLESLQNLKLNLAENDLDLSVMPYVLQLNKRDLPTAMTVEEMTRALRISDEPVLEAVATNGLGVFETLKALARMVLLQMKKAQTRPVG